MYNICTTYVQHIYNICTLLYIKRQGSHKTTRKAPEQSQEKIIKIFKIQKVSQVKQKIADQVTREEKQQAG